MGLYLLILFDRFSKNSGPHFAKDAQSLPHSMSISAVSKDNASFFPLEKNKLCISKCPISFGNPNILEDKFIIKCLSKFKFIN